MHFRIKQYRKKQFLLFVPELFHIIRRDRFRRRKGKTFFGAARSDPFRKFRDALQLNGFCRTDARNGHEFFRSQMAQTQQSVLLPGKRKDLFGKLDCAFSVCSGADDCRKQFRVGQGCRTERKTALVWPFHIISTDFFKLFQQDLRFLPYTQIFRILN